MSDVVAAAIIGAVGAVLAAAIAAIISAFVTVLIKWRFPEPVSATKKPKPITTTPEPVTIKQVAKSVPIQKGQFWVLKTAPTNGESLWLRFKMEGVIATGWREIKVDPSRVTQEELRDAVRRAYPAKKPGSVNDTANKLKLFASINVTDVVLLCDGYNSEQQCVYVYGMATVTGPFFDDATSDWWRFKYKADITPIERTFSAPLLRKALEMDSLIGAIHGPYPHDKALAVVTAIQQLEVDRTATV